MDVLEQIAAFREALSKQKALEEVVSWADRAGSIETSLGVDPRASANERANVEMLKEAVSDAILAVGVGREPDTSPISVRLTALQYSIERRTIGPDGNPLRS